MSDLRTDTDVLIIGAGPVGLFLAAECARRGIRSFIVEAKASQSEHSKALAIMPRTMEIFDMAGIAQPFLKVANRVSAIALVDRAGTLARTEFAPRDTPYPFVAMVPQNVTEELLATELHRRGGQIDYCTTFVSAVERQDSVSATLDCDGKLREIRAAFMVGCDGAHSSTRHLLGMSFEGQAYDASFMLADVETNEALPANEMQLCPSVRGPLAIFPLSGTRRRIVATIDHPQTSEPSLELVRALINERGPPELEAEGLYWSSYFRVHHRHVQELRRGRIFLAGDAAHIHSPIGGQGMNTGLQDVWNLVWKLDLAIRGKASEALIDSYSRERLPVIRKVVEMTHLMTKVLGTPSRSAQTLRDFAIPLLFRMAPFRQRMINQLSQLNISYSPSPIVIGRGHRIFDDTLRGGNGIRSKFLLMLPEAADETVKIAAQELCDQLSDLVELRNSCSQDLKLIRPDGYIAHGPDKPDVRVIGSIRSLLKFIEG